MLFAPLFLSRSGFGLVVYVFVDSRLDTFANFADRLDAPMHQIHPARPLVFAHKFFDSIASKQQAAWRNKPVSLLICVLVSNKIRKLPRRFTTFRNSWLEMVNFCSTRPNPTYKRPSTNDATTGATRTGGAQNPA